MPISVMMVTPVAVMMVTPVAVMVKKVMSMEMVKKVMSMVMVKKVMPMVMVKKVMPTVMVLTMMLLLTTPVDGAMTLPWGAGMPSLCRGDGDTTIHCRCLGDQVMSRW